MNISKKKLALQIVQHIASELGAMQDLGDVDFNISRSDIQANYRNWAQQTLTFITDAIDKDCVFVGQFDGSAKPNPGEMKIGGYIKNLKDMDKPLYSFSLDKGYGTNNRAEYMALIKLLEVAIERGVKRINIYGDSNLAVQQVNGKWKANKDMAPLRDQAIRLLKNFEHWSLSHVVRSLNAEADLLTR